MIKRIISTLLFVTFVSIFMINVASSQVVNGNFEDGVNGWTEYNADKFQSYYWSPTGSYVGYIGDDTNSSFGGYGGMYQDTDFTGYDILNLDVNYLNGASPILNIRIDDTVIYSRSTALTSGEVIPVSYDVSGISGTHRIGVYTASDSDAFVDNFVLSGEGVITDGNVTVTPESGISLSGITVSWSFSPYLEDTYGEVYAGWTGDTEYYFLSDVAYETKTNLSGTTEGIFGDYVDTATGSRGVNLIGLDEQDNFTWTIGLWRNTTYYDTSSFTREPFSEEEFIDSDWYNYYIIPVEDEDPLPDLPENETEPEEPDIPDEPDIPEVPDEPDFPDNQTEHEVTDENDTATGYLNSSWITGYRGNIDGTIESVTVPINGTVTYIGTPITQLTDRINSISTMFNQTIPTDNTTTTVIRPAFTGLPQKVQNFVSFQLLLLMILLILNR